MSRQHCVIKWLLLTLCLGLLGFLPLQLAAQTPSPDAGPGEEQPLEMKAENGVPDKAGDDAAAADKDAEQWFDKGILLSVYGNYKAAVGAFKKAIEMAPGWASAHFQLGVAYGEMGNFAEAFKAIDAAIALEPQRGDFYYGRGRVRLMTGDYAKAKEDFQNAAERGSKDAIRYLKEKYPSGN
jgi:tetratricopeptide (TPR) repeat protein